MVCVRKSADELDNIADYVEKIQQTLKKPLEKSTKSKFLDINTCLI